MPDLVFEQMYYDAYRAGMDYGAKMSGAETYSKLPDDVENGLRARARKQAAQLEKLILSSPEQKLEVAAKVEEWIASAGESGLKLGDLQEALAGTFGYSRALTIARTETAWAMNTAQSAAVKANGWNYVRWLAALDACETCQELDAQTFPVDEYQEIAVAHPNCACTFEVVTDEEAAESEEPDLEDAAAATDKDEDELGAGDSGLNYTPPPIPGLEDLADAFAQLEER